MNLYDTYVWFLGCINQLIKVGVAHCEPTYSLGGTLYVVFLCQIWDLSEKKNVRSFPVQIRGLSNTGIQLAKLWVEAVKQTWLFHGLNESKQHYCFNEINNDMGFLS